MTTTTTAKGLGFSAALDITPGGRVVVGGVVREVVTVARSGRDWPYYQLRTHAPTPFETAGPDWVSWQTCGAV